VVVGYFVIGGFIDFVRYIDLPHTKFMDGLDILLTSIINSTVRGLTLFAYAIIIDYLAGKNAK